MYEYDYRHGIVFDGYKMLRLAVIHSEEDLFGSFVLFEYPNFNSKK